MAYLARVYVKSSASHSFSVADRKLTDPTIHRRRYAEDLLRIKDLAVLKRLEIAPIDMLVCHSHDRRLDESADRSRGTQEVMGNISQHKPQTEILHSWEEATGLPWDPFDSCVAHTRRGVVCPKCGELVVACEFACVLDLMESFSAVAVHSLSHTRENRFGPNPLLLCMQIVPIPRHEREPCG